MKFITVIVNVSDCPCYVLRYLVRAIWVLWTSWIIRVNWLSWLSWVFRCNWCCCVFNVNYNVLIALRNTSWNCYIWINNLVTLISKGSKRTSLVIAEFSTDVLTTTCLTVFW